MQMLIAYLDPDYLKCSRLYIASEWMDLSWEKNECIRWKFVVDLLHRFKFNNNSMKTRLKTTPT